MTLIDQPNYYDILDIKPDASPQEIREAYLRTKATYNKDSVALYSLVSASEREEMLRQVEIAYQILSDPEKRKEYDAHHGLMDSRDDPFSTNVVSIDRVPPMESSSEDDLLIPPSTDFGRNPARAQPTVLSSSDPFQDPVPPPFAPPAQPFQPAPVQAPTPVAPPAPTISPAAAAAAEAAQLLQQEIATQTEWPGMFLRRVREARKIAIEEMAQSTKISKTYLLALEEENFAKLPAAVFVRGFVVQVARILKLPTEKVAAAYMARYNKAQSEKNR